MKLTIESPRRKTTRLSYISLVVVYPFERKNVTQRGEKMSLNAKKLSGFHDLRIKSIKF